MISWITKARGAVVRKADHRQPVTTRREEARQVGRCRIRVIAANRVEDRYLILHQSRRCDLQRIFALPDQSPLHAIGGIGELHAAVADRTSAMRVQDMRFLADRGRHRHAVAGEQTLIAVTITNDFCIGCYRAVAFDQPADGRGEARRQPAGSQHCDFDHRNSSLVQMELFLSGGSSQSKDQEAFT
jgi:hypothetical protein